MKKNIVIIMLFSMLANFLLPRCAVELKDYELLSGIMKSQSILLYMFYFQIAPLKVVKALYGKQESCSRATKTEEKDNQSPAHANTSADFSLVGADKSVVLNRLLKGMCAGNIWQSLWMPDKRDIIKSKTWINRFSGGFFNVTILILAIFMVARPRSGIEYLFLPLYILRKPGFHENPGFFISEVTL